MRSRKSGLMQPDLVEGHIIPVQQFNYTFMVLDGESVSAMVGDNVISNGVKFET